MLPRLMLLRPKTPFASIVARLVEAVSCAAVLAAASPMRTELPAPPRVTWFAAVVFAPAPIAVRADEGCIGLRAECGGTSSRRMGVLADRCRVGGIGHRAVAERCRVQPRRLSEVAEPDRSGATRHRLVADRNRLRAERIRSPAERLRTSARGNRFAADCRGVEAGCCAMSPTATILVGRLRVVANGN